MICALRVEVILVRYDVCAEQTEGLARYSARARGNVESPIRRDVKFAREGIVIDSRCATRAAAA